MTMLLNKVVNAFAVSLVLVCGSVINVGVSLANDSLPVTPQAAVIASAATECPTDLTSLQPNMKKALQFIKSATFRNTMLASLEASIPEAISQSDGLAQQVAFLKREIARQEQERAHAEKVAREGLTDSSQPLKPCRHRKESAYCYAMDQYLISIASNLANEAFLSALQCYQREGVR